MNSLNQFLVNISEVSASMGYRLGTNSGLSLGARDLCINVFDKLALLEVALSCLLVLLNRVECLA